MWLTASLRQKATMLSRWKSESRAAAHDELCRFRSDIPRISTFFCFGTSSVVQRLSWISSNGLECYSELARDHTRILRALRAHSKSKVVWRCRLEGEFKRHFGVRIKRSCLRIYRELVSQEFSLQFSRKCMIWSKNDPVFIYRAAISNLITSPHLISFGPAANNLFQGSQNFLQAAYNLFRESQNSPRGTNSKAKSSRKCLIWHSFAWFWSNDIIYADCKTCLSNDPRKMDSNFFCYGATVLSPHRNVLSFTQRMHKPTWRPFTQ